MHRRRLPTTSPRRPRGRDRGTQALASPPRFSASGTDDDGAFLSDFRACASCGIGDLVVSAADRPTRATVDGRAYLDLQNLARGQHRPTDELHQLYALEGFLDRLASSRYADKLVLK